MTDQPSPRVVMEIDPLIGAMILCCLSLGSAAVEGDILSQVVCWTTLKELLPMVDTKVLNAWTLALRKSLVTAYADQLKELHIQIEMET